MHDFGDFEDAAKKSWQSFSTMKRFVCEASRLEYASWRLWYMHKQWKPIAAEAAPPSSSPSSSGIHAATTTSIATKAPMVPTAGASAANSTSAAMTASYSVSDDLSEMDATVRRKVLCIYCEVHIASLSCHGCCHDEYCVACFKLVHKKGHLATHTAVKIKEMPVRELERAVRGQFPLSVDPAGDGAFSSAAVTDGTMSGDSSAPHGASYSATGSSPLSSHNQSVHDNLLLVADPDGARTKCWELQLDVLLQRLMMNTVRHDNDISVHNIDDCESLGTAESVVSYPFLSGSEDRSDHRDHAKARLEEATMRYQDERSNWGSTEPGAGGGPCAGGGDAVVQDLSWTAGSAAPAATETPAMPLRPPMSPAASPSLAPMEPRDGVPPLFPPTTLVRTKSRRKNLICANCNGNHITIDCPLLESSLPQGQAGVGTVLRKCFTTLHNDNLSDSTHAFLGDEVSVRGGSNFAKPALSAPERIAKGASTWTSFGMGSISEDRSADVHDTLPMLGSLQPGPDGVQSWDSTSWLMTSLATELPLDVFESLRRAERDPQTKSAFDVDPSMSGWIYMKLPGSKWCKRYVSLHRNNLWEYLDDRDTTRPIGHANVGEGSVELDEMTGVEFTLTYYRNSAPNAPRVYCQIRCDTELEAQAWRDALDRATRLAVDDLFDRSPGSPGSPGSSIATHELGKGRFANVHRARRKSLSAEFCAGLMDCALKIIDKPTFWSLVSRETEREDTVVREILTQTVLTVRAGTAFCPVIRLLSVFETRNELVMELELMREGDLHEEIVANTAVTEDRASFLVASLVRAIDFCQRNGVAHRDVKLSNLALDYCTSQAGERHSVIKIADFGMAAFVREDGMLKGRCGTPGFVAPEILTAGKGEAYPASVDMFSVGVVAYTMLCGYEPFFGVNDEELIQMNKAASYDFEEPEWNSISDEAKEMIAMMMEKDPVTRITPKEALGHPFLQEASVKLEEIFRVETTVSALRLL